MTLFPLAFALLAAASTAWATELPAGFVKLSEVAPSIRQDEANSCILTEAAAKAVKAANESVKAKGYGLMVQDCWQLVATIDIQMKGYVAKKSSHSLGSGIYLTLTDKAGTPLDMGPRFNLFGDRSHISPQAKANWQVIVEAMETAGFCNYQNNEWLFGLKSEPSPETYFDFPIIKGEI